MKELKRTSFRNTISTDPSDRVIFGYELLSQPDPTLLERIPHITHRNQGVVALAKEGDVIILNQPIDREYLTWLRSHDLGTDNIIEIESDGRTPLTKLITECETELIPDSDQVNRIFVPRISTLEEAKAAKHLNARLFGSQEDVVLKFYDKCLFKLICESLGIPTIPFHVLDEESGIEAALVRETALDLIRDNGEVIAKAPMSSNGADTARLNKANIDEVSQQIAAAKKTKLLLEKKVDIKHEYSSQWVIDFEGRINLIGISEMRTTPDGAHIGNTHPPPPHLIKSIIRYSQIIGEKMRKEGYIGNFQIDFMETDNDDLYISENNTRVSGSSFAWEIFYNLTSRHEDSRTFISTKFKLDNPTSFNSLKERCRHDMYTGDCGQGFFPYDIGALPITGQLMGLITAQDMDNAKQILKNLEKKGLNPSLTSRIL